MKKVLKTFGKQDVWTGKIFSPMRRLQIDSRGHAGELFIKECLETIGYEVQHTNKTDPKHKDWDLVVADEYGEKFRLEIKTATLGKTGSFQHENIDPNRRYEGLVILDITPEEIYLTCVAKYKIPWSKIHRRKDSIFYKWDWSLKNVPERKVESLDDFKKIFSAMSDDIKVNRKGKKPVDEI